MRLITQTPPLPLDSLDSLLARLGALNHYPTPQWWAGLLPPPVPVPHLLRATEHYRILGELTGLSLDTLYSLTLHRFVPLYPADQATPAAQQAGDLARPLLGRHWLSWYTCGLPAIQICPACWQQDRAILLPWFLRQVTTCPRHQVLLVDRCSGCGRRLRLNLRRSGCLYCGQEPQRLPAISVADHAPSRELTALIWQTLGSLAPGEAAALGGDAPSGPRTWLAPATILAFLSHFGQLLMEWDYGNPGLELAEELPGAAWAAPPPQPWVRVVAQRHRVLTAVARLLLDWPAAWYELLTRLVIILGVGRRNVPPLPDLLWHQCAGEEWTWLHEGWRLFVEAGLWDRARHYRGLAHYLGGQRGAGAYSA